jgi:hypothetical protein
VEAFRVDGDCKFTGTISHDLKFSFDPERFVDSRTLEGIRGEFLHLYADYKKQHVLSEFESTIYNSKDSFISLIESQNQILWSNPMVKPVLSDYADGDYGNYEFDFAEWKQLQDLVITKYEIAAVLLNPNK